MLGRGLEEILNEKEVAQDLILDILEFHGSAFILDILEKNGAGIAKQSHLIKGLYDKLNRKYPSLKKEKIREMVAIKFGISDKAVQKHIYKSRKK